MKKKFEQNLISKVNNQLFSVRKLPKKYRDDLFKLFSFIHVTNNFSQSDPTDPESFKYIVRRWQHVKREDSYGHFDKIDDSLNENILSNISYLVHRYGVSPKDVDDYLRSIAIVLRNKPVNTPQDLVRYLQISAEAPASMLVKAAQLPNALLHHMKMQARATKYVLLLTSIASDGKRGRCYFPSSELKKFGLTALDKEAAISNQKKFEEFIAFQLKRYHAWQDEARRGDDFMPKKLKPLLRKNRAIQEYIVKRIEKNPMSIFEEKPKLKMRHKLNARVAYLKKR